MGHDRAVCVHLSLHISVQVRVKKLWCNRLRPSETSLFFYRLLLQLRHFFPVLGCVTPNAKEKAEEEVARIRAKKERSISLCKHTHTRAVASELQMERSIQKFPLFLSSSFSTALHPYPHLQLHLYTFLLYLNGKQGVSVFSHLRTLFFLLLFSLSNLAALGSLIQRRSRRIRR